MREIFGFLFKVITEPLGLPVDFLTEWVLLGIFEFIAFKKARRLVGKGYKNGFISGRASGSAAYGFFKIVYFVAIWFITYITILFGKFIMTHWIIISIFVGIIGLLIISVLLIRFFKKRKTTC